jgi:hypothetical protein
MQLTDLERRVGNFALAGSIPLLGILRQQFESSSIVDRELTGAGFFTQVATPPNTPKVGELSFSIDDVIGEIEGDPSLGFRVHVQNGVIDYLEGYTLTESLWPEKIDQIQLTYMGPNSSDSRPFLRLPPNLEVPGARE